MQVRARGEIVDNSLNFGQLMHWEELTPRKADVLLRIIKEVLDDEMRREGRFIGAAIFTQGSALNYGTAPNFPEYVVELTARHITFDSPEEAQKFANVLVGVLLMALTPFRINYAQDNPVDETREMPIVPGNYTPPDVPKFSLATEDNYRFNPPKFMNNI